MSGGSASSASATHASKRSRPSSTRPSVVSATALSRLDFEGETVDPGYPHRSPARISVGACACQISPSTFTCPSGASEVMASPTVPIIVCTPTCRLSAPAVANAEEPETELEDGGERDHEQAPTATAGRRARGSGRGSGARLASVEQFTASSHNRHSVVPRGGATLPGMARTLGLGDAGSGAEALAAAYERGYSQGDLLTIGIEEELILVDAASLQPAEAIESVLGAVCDPRVTAEFRAAQVELVSPVGVTVAGLALRARGDQGGGGRRARRQGEAARGGDAPDVERPGADHRPAPLPPDRRRAPVGAAARPAERAPRPRGPRRRRRGARDLQRRPGLPPGARRARRQLALFRGERLRVSPRPASSSARTILAPGSRPRSPPGASWPRSSPGAQAAGSSPTSPTSGGTSASAPISGRSSSGSRTRRPRSTTRRRSPRSSRASSRHCGCGCAPAIASRRIPHTC